MCESEIPRLNEKIHDLEDKIDILSSNVEMLEGVLHHTLDDVNRLYRKLNDRGLL
jgi:hypothetical protein